MAQAQATNRDLADWLAYVEAVHPKSIELGLDRVRAVAQRLGVTRPGRHRLIVAGTNGKGSTAIAAEALARAAGHRVGTTLSPHVHAFNERVRLDGVPLADTALAELFAAVDAAREGVTLTYFEFSALVALLAFVRADVDLAILEVGLGGRLDAFNLVDAETAVVTSIGLDHQDWLGHDLEQIGREKAGVFRRYQRVILGSVTDSVVDAARALDCDVRRLGIDFEAIEHADRWVYRRADGTRLEVPRSDLAPANCALALAAIEGTHAPGDEDAARALTGLTLTGRMEQHRLGSVPLIVDVAHNPAGAAFLARQLSTRFPGRRYVAILGMLADKDAEGVVGALDGLVGEWITVSTEGPRGQSAAALGARVGRRVSARPAAGFEAALAAARSCVGGNDGILAFGSFSLVAQARDYLRALEDRNPGMHPACMK